MHFQTKAVGSTRTEWMPLMFRKSIRTECIWIAVARCQPGAASSLGNLDWCSVSSLTTCSIVKRMNEIHIRRVFVKHRSFKTYLDIVYRELTISNVSWNHHALWPQPFHVLEWYYLRGKNVLKSENGVEKDQNSTSFFNTGMYRTGAHLEIRLLAALLIQHGWPN